MQDIIVFEATNYVNDGIYFSDVRKKLVAESFTFARTFDETSNIDNFKPSGEDCFRTGDSGKNVQSRVWNAHETDVWFDGTEREVRGLSL